MKKDGITLGGIGTQIGGVLKKMRAYQALIFFLFVAALYGFILWRINTYSNAPASQSAENAQMGSQPHVDQATVQKMLELQNNSVSVQALFNQARANPFQE
jgi:hypothetical protein